MKRFLILLVAFSTFISCNHPEIKTLLIDESTDTYHLKISRVENKVDENGVAQCDHYSTTKQTKDSILSYGYNAFDLITSNYKASQKYFETPFTDSLRSFYTITEIKILQDEGLDYRQIVHDKILDYFNICIEEKDSILKGYTLKKMDDFALPVSLQLGSSITGYNDTLFCKGTNLSSLCDMYDSYAKWFIQNNMDDTLKYNMDIKLIGDLESARKEFQKLGLDLEEAVFEKKFYKIYSCK